VECTDLIGSKALHPHMLKQEEEKQNRSIQEISLGEAKIEQYSFVHIITFGCQ
jgi:hypothetical protein